MLGAGPGGGRGGPAVGGGPVVPHGGAAIWRDPVTVWCSLLLAFSWIINTDLCCALGLCREEPVARQHTLGRQNPSRRVSAETLPREAGMSWKCSRPG